MNKPGGKYKDITHQKEILITLARHGCDETESAEILGISGKHLSDFLKKNKDISQK